VELLLLLRLLRRLWAWHLAGPGAHLGLCRLLPPLLLPSVRLLPPLLLLPVVGPAHAHKEGATRMHTMELTITLAQCTGVALAVKMFS
jgi:hypothetical protein